MPSNLSDRGNHCAPSVFLSYKELLMHNYDNYLYIRTILDITLFFDIKTVKMLGKIFQGQWGRERA